MEVYVKALRNNFYLKITLFAFVIAHSITLFNDWCFVDKDREEEPHRAFNNIFPHDFSVDMMI